MKRCDYCGKEYPDDTTACAIDGQPLARSGPPPLSPPGTAPAPIVAHTFSPDQINQMRRAAANRNMLVGGLWCVGGIVVTVITYAGATGGGTYVVAWGAIIFRAIQFFRGLLSR